VHPVAATVSVSVLYLYLYICVNLNQVLLFPVKVNACETNCCKSTRVFFCIVLQSKYINILNPDAKLFVELNWIKIRKYCRLQRKRGFHFCFPKIYLPKQTWDSGRRWIWHSVRWISLVVQNVIASYQVKWGSRFFWHKTQWTTRGQTDWEGSTRLIIGNYTFSIRLEILTMMVKLMSHFFRSNCSVDKIPFCAIILCEKSNLFKNILFLIRLNEKVLFE